MATRLRWNGTRTVPEAWTPFTTGPQADITTTPHATGSTVFRHNATFDSDDPAGEWKMSRLTGTWTAHTEFWSPKISAQVTISGLVSFALKPVNIGAPAFTGKARARLYKITAGGSAVRTLIVQADSATFSTTAQVLWSGTPATGVTVVPGERLILLITFVDVTQGDPNELQLTASSIGDTGTGYMEVTETVTFDPTNIPLYFRRTTDIGIGSYMDLATVRGGSAATTAVVATGAGLSEKQWTKTSGGVNAEWISPRVKNGFMYDEAGFPASGLVYAFESNAAANCGLQLKVYHYAHATGVETLIATITRWTTSLPFELPTTAGLAMTIPSTPSATQLALVQAMPFEEDDRFVVKAFIIAAGGTMASGHTCTLHYDHNTTGTGNMNIGFYIAVFKDAADPDRSEAIPGGMSTLGLGNDGA